MSFENLVERIANGDADAETELVQQLGRGTSILLRRLAGDAELAQDLYQETFRIVLISLRQGKLQEPDKLAAFVRGTAKNLLRSEWRKRDRRGPHDDVDDMPLVDEAPGQWDRARLAEDRKRVRQILDELPSDRDRQLLYRHYLAEEGKNEICDDLGLGSNQFNVSLFRARQRFKRLVEERTGDATRRGFELIPGGQGTSQSTGGV